MTIPEASQSILRAGALGKSGEVFVQDMGEQAPIVDLAHERIFVVNSDVGAKLPDFSAVMPGLESAVQASGDKALLDALRRLVVEFQPAD